MAHQQLTKYIDPKNLMNLHQSSFQARHSTITAVVYVYNYWGQIKRDKCVPYLGSSSLSFVAYIQPTDAVN